MESVGLHIQFASNCSIAGVWSDGAVAALCVSNRNHSVWREPRAAGLYPGLCRLELALHGCWRTTALWSQGRQDSAAHQQRQEPTQRAGLVLETNTFATVTSAGQK